MTPASTANNATNRLMADGTRMVGGGRTVMGRSGSAAETSGGSGLGMGGRTLAANLLNATRPCSGPQPATCAAPIGRSLSVGLSPRHATSA